MILGFSTQLNGKPTNFVEKIWKGIKECISEELYNKIASTKRPLELIEQYQVDGEIYEKVKPKIHTIRDDEKDRWDEGTMIDFFINVRKKNMLRFAPRIPVISTQEILMTYAHSDLIQISIDGRELFTYSERFEFAVNDGFDNWEDFFKFFYPKIQASKQGIYKPKLIHWTDKIY